MTFKKKNLRAKVQVIVHQLFAIWILALIWISNPAIQAQQQNVTVEWSVVSVPESGAEVIFENK